MSIYIIYYIISINNILSVQLYIFIIIKDHNMNMYNTLKKYYL